jgi:hypothetical protein
VTEEAWTQGLHDLFMLPDREMSEGYAADRGEVYRRVLSHLTDAAWLHAVDVALRRERWFPAPAALLEYAAEYSPPQALPAPRSREAIEESRTAARANLTGGLAIVRAELVRRGLLAPGAPEPVASMPRAAS